MQTKVKTKKKLDLGMWKRTFSIFVKFRIPWFLYLIDIGLGFLSGKLTVLYLPYYNSIKLGKFDDVEGIRKYVLLLLLCIAVNIVTAIPTFYASSITKKNLEKNLIERSLRLPVRFYEKSASNLVGWIMDGSACANGIITSLAGFLTGLYTTFLSITAMPAMQLTMAYIIPFVVLYVVIGTLVEGRLMFLREKVHKTATADLTAYLSEHLGFFTQIKQLHSVKEEVKRGSVAVNQYYKAEIKEAVYTLVNNVVNGSLTDVLTILIFVLGVPMVRSNTITLEELNLFLSYVLLAYQSLSSIPRIYTSLMYYNGQLFYVGTIMNEKSEVVKRNYTMDREDEDIHFEHVSFGYSEEKKVLDDVSFTIPKGKVTMVCGPNGSGKTTLFKIFQRFYTPDSGEIKFGDVPAEEINLDEWRQSFTYVLQDSQLFDGSIKENIRFGTNHDVTDEEIISAAKLANADEFIKEFDEGYDFLVGDNGSRLSGGQKQRIAIARALMLNPSYLLLDEATCNMDAVSEKKVTDALLNLMKGRTTVLISHDVNMLEHADNVVVLRDGAVEFSGTKEEAIQNSTTLQDFISKSKVQVV